MSRKILALTLIVGLLYLPFDSVAQWTLGGEGGLQLNNIRLTGVGKLLNGIPKSVITPYARISGTYQISDKFGFRPGIGYSQKGFQFAKGLDVNIFRVPIGIGAKVATTIQYFEVPLEGVYSFTKGNTTYILTGGANIGYAVHGSVVPKASVIIDIKLADIPINLDENIYNRWDLSATAGIGMVKEAKHGKMILQARLVQSLTNFLDDPIVGIKIKPYAYQFSVGYQIPIGSG